MKINIQIKFILITISAVLIIASLTAAIGFRSFATSYQKMVDERIFAQAQELQILFQDLALLGLDIGHVRGLSQECKKMVATIPYAKYCFVMDKNGKVFYHNEFSERMKMYADPLTKQVLQSNHALVLRWKDEKKHTIFDYSLPIRSADHQVLGYVRVGVGSEIINNEILRLRNFYFFLTLIVTGIASFLIFWLFKIEILKPMERLALGVSRIGRGDLDYQIDVGTRDEVYDLAMAFNAMAANLKKITASRDDLNKEVSIRQKTEKDLIKEKERAQQYLDIAGVMMIALDVDGNVVLVNERGCEILGYAKEDILGKNWFKYFLPQKVVPQAQEIHNRLISGEEDLLRYSETSVLTKRKEEKIILWSNSLLKDETDAVIGVLSSGEDVTERRISEKLTTIQKELGIALSCIHDVKSAFDVLIDAIFKIEGVDCAIIFAIEGETLEKSQLTSRGLDDDSVNAFIGYLKNFLDFQGISKDRLIYRGFSEIELDKSLQSFMQGLRTLSIIPMLYAGQPVSVLAIGSYCYQDIPLRTRHAIESIASYFGWVIVRIRAEERLRLKEKHYRELVQNANSIILRMDMQGNVTFFNEYAQKFFGYNENEILGKSVLGTIVPFQEDGGRDLKEMIYKICQDPDNYAFNENQNICKSGQRIWVAWTNKAVYDERGNQEVLCIGTDISKRKQAEGQLENIFEDLQKVNQELKETQDQLLQSEKMVAIGHLSAGIAHEVKNPLAVILLGANALMKKFSVLDRQSQEHIKMIRNAAERANRVITDLLTFSRDTDLRLGRVAIQDILDDSITLAKTAFRYQKIVFRKEYPSNKIEVMADKILMEQVFFNLFANAVDAIKSEGFIHIKAFVRREKKASVQKLFIEVSDNGEGMKPEVLNRVFEPFFTTKEEGKGNGLGLSVSYMILQRHGADITAESQPGKGTTFKITFPLSS